MTKVWLTFLSLVIFCLTVKAETPAQVTAGAVAPKPVCWVDYFKLQDAKDMSSVIVREEGFEPPLTQNNPSDLSEATSVTYRGVEMTATYWEKRPGAAQDRGLTLRIRIRKDGITVLQSTIPDFRQDSVHRWDVQLGTDLFQINCY